MNKNILRFMLVAVMTVFAISQAEALTLDLPAPGDDMIGRLKTAVVEPGDTFHTIARRHDIGFYEMVEANRDLNPKAVLKPWSKVIIPSQYILPNGARQGIVINIAELRMYYYPPGKTQVQTYPVGIGREGWETPTGSAKVVGKKYKPTWTVPQSVRLDAARRGSMLPRSVPPGPDNPLGDYAIRLSLPAILIHGTNEPSGVGMRSSAGCLRMYPEDIKKLFGQVDVGNRVRIVDEPFKAGWRGRDLYLEAHQPLQEQLRQFGLNLTPMVHTVMGEIGRQKVNVDWQKAVKIAETQSGLPALIGRR